MRRPDENLSAPFGLDAILMANELKHRPSRPADHAGEARALRALAQALADEPRGVLQRLVEVALELCRADSMGVSLIEPGGGARVFRWPAVAGEWARHSGESLPRDASPCGVVVERDETLLFGQPGRYFPDVAAVTPPLVEVLLAPFHFGGEPVGTVWACAHSDARRFDAEDARLLESLARFAAAAYQTVATLDAAEAGKAELERRVVVRTRELGLVNEALAQSGAQLRAIFDHAAVGLAQADAATGRFLRVNDALCTMLDLPREELLRMTFVDVMHPDDVAASEASLRAAMAGAKPGGRYRVEQRLVRRGGEPIWVKVEVDFVQGVAGRPARTVAVIEDVTERRRAEAALRASEAKLTAIFDRATVGLSELGLDGQFLRVNDEMCRLLGRPRAWLLEACVADVTHADDLPPTLTAVAGLVATGASARLDKRYLHADGSVVHASSSLTRLDGADGRPGTLLAVTVDLTERVRAEEARRASEALARAVAQNLPNGAAFVVDADLRYVLAAGEALGAAGLGPADLEGKRLAEALPPGLAANYTLQYSKALAGEPFQSEHVSHGREYVTHGAPLRDGGGRVTAALAVSYDITDRKRAERALQRTEESLRQTLEAARMGTWRWDVPADAHVRDANLNRLLGLEAVETRGPFEDFIGRVHPDDRATVRAAFATTAEAGRPLALEFRVVWPGGAVRWLRDQGDVFRDDDRGRAYVAGACVDVTERREAEEALRRARDELEARVAARTAELARSNEQLRGEVRQRERAEAARNELRRQLSTAQEDERRRVARDLHDQTSQLLAGLSLAVKAVATSGPLPPAAAAPLAEVQRVADELGRQVHGLAVRLRPTALDDLGLAVALRQLVGEWSARAGAPIDLHTTGFDSGRLPPEVETVLYRVVQEALTNVAKYAGASNVSVVVSLHDGVATAVVEDDGAGFDPEAAGSGRLGLVGMRERVTLVGGTLDVESSPGAGTTIIARLPVGAPRGGAG